jgi:hypothetical protein
MGSGLGFSPIVPGNGLIDGSSPVTLESSIVDAYGPPFVGVALLGCRLAPIDGGFNVADDGSCGFKSGGTSKSFAHINLGAFGNNGGPTPTMALNSLSDAIDRIPLTAVGCGTTINLDQRGVPRPQPPGGRCDSGAVEHLFAKVPVTGTTCNGVFNQTFDGDVTVFPGQSCIFLGGGITGRVRVEGGRFELRYATVGGNVEIDGASTFTIGPSASIGGNLETHNVEPNAERNEVCGSNVKGNLEFLNNESAVRIGSTDPTSCLGNVVGTNLEVHNNSGSTAVDGNTVAGDLLDHNNSAPTEIFNNIVTGNLECKHDSTITGGLNFASRRKASALCSSLASYSRP